MKKTFYLTLLLLGIPLMSAHAEWINGTVGKVNTKTDTVTIKRIVDEKGNQNLPSELELRVNRDANLKNLASLNDLKMGDTIKADVQENRNLGLWEAKAIELRNAK